jgi:hypothetical protein
MKTLTTKDYEDLILRELTAMNATTANPCSRERLQAALETALKLPSGGLSKRMFETAVKTLEYDKAILIEVLIPEQRIRFEDTGYRYLDTPIVTYIHLISLKAK